MTLHYWVSDKSGLVPLENITVLTSPQQIAQVHALIDKTKLDAYDKALAHAAFENHQVIEIGYTTARVPAERVMWKSAIVSGGIANVAANNAERQRVYGLGKTNDCTRRKRSRLV